ncbi:maltokinase [Frankineae bacterium MT45]|nr:maltokinase [Frankineae bacterium MT45]
MIGNERELAPLLAAWAPEQRWFAGKGREAEFSVQHLANLSDEPVQVAIYTLTAQYQPTTDHDTAAEQLVVAGETLLIEPEDVEVYQVPLAIYTEPAGHLEHALIGVLTGDGTVTAGSGGRAGWVYDALQDKDVTGLWMEGIRDSRVSGPLRFERFTEDDLPMEEPSLALTGEQSNTSLVYGGSAILKVFRRLEPGINPDIEVHRSLTELGAHNIAPLFGSMSAQIGDGEVSLAMLQEFMRTASDGWELAKTSVRDLMAEADLHASEAGGDFAGEAERLGAATAAVHSDLADAFGTAMMSSDDVRGLATSMHRRLDAALRIVPQLGEVETGLRATFDAFRAEADGLTVSTQRIHGDLHLGQALRTAQRWILLDFEGEPAASLPARRAFDSPLRDLAGMMRSFDYAARYQLVDAGQVAQLEYRAVEWAERNRSAFCDGYAEASGHDPRDQEALMRGYEADKAVYEAVYETRNRPSWLVVPLASLARLVAA